MSEIIQNVSDWETKETKRCTLSMKRSAFGGVTRLELRPQHMHSGGQDAGEIFVAKYCQRNFFRKGHFDIYATYDGTEEHVGVVRFPGWLSSLSLITTPNEEKTHGGIYFSSTSRDGKLMTLSAILPEVASVKCDERTSKLLCQSVAQLRLRFPLDIANIICSYCGGKLSWQEKLEGLNFKNLKNFSSGCCVYVNKRPMWNTHINAYTLEFNGRAQIPSVHNFQLTREDSPSNVVLQLGKFEKNDYNLDYGKPLTTFQAFAISVCVVARTFVRD